jgi:peroxiredoxin
MAFGTVTWILSAAFPAAGTTFYVDCSGGSDAHEGTSPSTPWESLDRVNKHALAPGDSILFKRGTQCSDMLWPKGSGRQGQAITLSAYGTGPLPIIDGGANQAAIKLYDQQYWHIDNMEVLGGTPFGIYISGKKGELHHLRLTNLVVHDVGGEVKNKESGLIVVTPEGPELTFHDVVIDGVTAYNTTQWVGILVGGDDFGGTLESPRSSDITIRHSIVHDVYGDGIVLYQVDDGLIEKNVAWNTGMQATRTIGTPNAIWTWMCLSDSPGVDGGVYDVDFGCSNNIVQYNYAHDSQGYCVSVFGAGSTTTNSVVRYNVCAGNARSPRLARRQGEIFLSTWNGGSLDGVQIYNNTIYWNPPTDAPALNNSADFTGKRPNFFKSNIIYSTVPSLIESNDNLKLDHNLYWYTGMGAPQWTYSGSVFRNLSAYQQQSGQDAHGLHADPGITRAEHSAGAIQSAFRLRSDSPAIDAGIDVGDMGGHDVFGVPVPQGKAYDMGAFEFAPGKQASARRDDKQAPLAASFELGDARGATHRLAQYSGRWVLLTFVKLDTQGAHPEEDSSRSQGGFLRSMLHQFEAKGGRVLLGGTGLQYHQDNQQRQRLINLTYDWSLEHIPLLLDNASSSTAKTYGVSQTPTTFLISPEGRIVKRWDGFAAAPDLGLTLQGLLGAADLFPGVARTR